jgi:galactokinase
MTGGGFGGCAVSLVQASAVEGIAAQLKEGYLAQTRIQPALFISRPAGGATILSPG